VQCAMVVDGGMHAPEVQWYLGLKGILLPGKGIGIDAVEANSPAEQIGLQPGMVITVCNGIALVDESSMQEAIRISGGVLQMTLLSADGSQVLEGVAVMSRVSVVNF
jgi:S1-C subfamily serine protease